MLGAEEAEALVEVHCGGVGCFGFEGDLVRLRFGLDIRFGVEIGVGIGMLCAGLVKSVI